MSIQSNGVEWGQSETSVELSSCRNCGEHVSPQFARVFGDNDDAVYACTNCSTFRELALSTSGQHSD